MKHIMGKQTSWWKTQTWKLWSLKKLNSGQGSKYTSLVYKHNCFSVSLRIIKVTNAQAYPFHWLILTGIDVTLSNFCFLDKDCQVVGKSQGSSPGSARKYPVKPPRQKVDSQTIDTYNCPVQEQLNIFFPKNQQFLLASQAGFEPAWQIKPTTPLTELSGWPWYLFPISGKLGKWRNHLVLVGCGFTRKTK